MIPTSLSAGEVMLSAWEEGEAALYLAGRDDTVFSFTTEDPDLDAATARANIERAREDPRQAPFAIRELDGTPVGNMSVTRQGRDVVLSYWLSPSARGRGWGTMALEAASQWALEVWEPDRLMLEILPSNQASVRTAERAGYRRAGLRLESSCGGPALLFQRP